MLAGLGERDIVWTLALHDPDDFVRATACQYLLWTAQPDDDQISELLAERLSEDTSSIVRATILREEKDGKLVLQPEQLLPQL